MSILPLPPEPSSVQSFVVAPSGFRVWWVSAFYIVAQIALGFHLSHGLWSLFQTLGVPGSGSNHDWRRSFARVFASIIVLGNISFPVAVLTGLVE